MDLSGALADAFFSGHSTPRASGDLPSETELPKAPSQLDHVEHIERIDVQWKALFTFTTRLHTLPLAVAVTLAVVSGIVIPALALLLGKIFDSFTDFGIGTINGSTLMDQISTNALYLVALGSSSWLLNGCFFTFWLFFGELQAKEARSRLFSGMLNQQISWFDSHRAGVGSLLPRIQTSVLSAPEEARES